MQEARFCTGGGEVERRRTSNDSQSLLPNSTVYLHTRLLNAIIHVSDHITAQMASIRTLIVDMKRIPSRGNLLTASAEDKKQSRTNDMKNFLAKNFPGYETTVQK